jgi:hypothetical protein
MCHARRLRTNSALVLNTTVLIIVVTRHGSKPARDTYLANESWARRVFRPTTVPLPAPLLVQSRFLYRPILLDPRLLQAPARQAVLPLFAN